MTDAQRDKLWALCGRYNVDFREDDYTLNTLDSHFMPGWVEGWIGGEEGTGHTIYIGVDPEGNSHS